MSFSFIIKRNWSGKFRKLGKAVHKYVISLGLKVNNIYMIYIYNLFMTDVTILIIFLYIYFIQRPTYTHTN